MGRDKALVPFRGEALIQRVIRRLQPAASEVIITARQPEVYAFTGARMCADLLPGAGALGGLYTALACASYEYVGAAACDMPFCRAEIFLMLEKILVEGGADAAVPVSPDGTYEVLHAVYRRKTCLKAVKAALEDGKQKMISWFPQVKVELVQPVIWQALDLEGLAFLNVNTPEELKKAVDRG